MNSFRKQINYDSSQVNYISEGTSFFLTLDKSNITGNPSVITAFTTAKLQAPIDMIVDAIAIIIWIDNPANPGVGDIIPTTAAKVMIRDSLSQVNWIFTSGGALGQGNPVPVNLIAGPKPTQLPSPRPLYQNTVVEFDIQPAGYDIVDFNVTFYGRRIDMMPPWERDQVCGDPRTSGAYWVYFDPTTLERADSAANPLGRGGNVNTFLRIPVLPFDILITSISGFITEDEDSASPIARAWYEFKLTDMNNKKELSYNWIPSTILGGSTLNSSVVVPAAAVPLDSEQVLEYLPRSMPLNVAWIIRQQSSVGLEARSVFSPLDPALFPTQAAQLMLIGMRVPTSEISAGWPYYNRQDGSLRCPPGSDGQLPGYPGGPCPPYVGPQFNGNGNGNGSANGLGEAGMPPQAHREERGVWMHNAPGSWPGSMPFPPPAINQHAPVTIRNPIQDGGQIRLPNRGPGADGWGIPGGPQDHRGPRFRNTGGR